MKRELLEPKATKAARETPSPIANQQQVAAIPSVQRILQLQRTIGNRAVQRLIQTKLRNATAQAPEPQPVSSSQPVADLAALQAGVGQAALAATAMSGSLRASPSP